MIDSQGRNIDYVRISLTDRCNLRCCYCMPGDYCGWMDQKNLLTDDQLVRVCAILAELGIRKIKLTGGEPLLRSGVSRLAERLGRIPGIQEVTLTTNGVLLKDQLESLLEAGIRKINVSLDAMDRECYRRITGSDSLDRVKEGLLAAVQQRDRVTVKINMVPVRGINDQEILPVAAWAKTYPVAVRFIEMMPIGLGRQFRGIAEHELRQQLELQYGPLAAEDRDSGNGPARYWKLPGFAGSIGFISAISHRFCGKCNRIRLTSDGMVKPCLQYKEAGDVGRLLRGQFTDNQIREFLRELILQKPQGHAFDEHREPADQEKRLMSGIGG